MPVLTRKEVEAIAKDFKETVVWKHCVDYWLQTDEALRKEIRDLQNIIADIKREQREQINKKK